MKTLLNYLRDVFGVVGMGAIMVALLTWELIRGGWRSLTGKTLVGDTDEDREQDLR